MKRTKFAVAAFCVALVAAPVAQAQSMTQALASAYENSGLLTQNRALLRAADEGVAQAVAATLPVVNWSANASRTDTNAVGVPAINAAQLQISSSLTVYDGGVGQLGIDAQKELVLSTRESLRNVEQNVLQRAVQAYMNLRREREFVSLRQSNVNVLEQEFRAAQDRFDVGEVTRTDVALAEARLALARSLLASAQGNLEISTAEFEAAIGRTPGALSGVAPASVPQSLQQAEDYALRNHPAMREVQHSVAAAEINLRRAQAAFVPRVTLNGSVSRNNNGNSSANFGLSTGGPIYSGGQIPSQMRQVQANRDAARAGLHITRLNIDQQVANAYARLEVARASRRASDQQIAAAEVAFRGVREEATLGSRTTLDVLNAEQELLDARANLIAAQTDEVIASYAVLAAIGRLTVEQLGLPVEQYDPAQYYNMVKDAPTALSPEGQMLNRVLEALNK